MAQQQWKRHMVFRSNDRTKPVPCFTPLLIDDALIIHKLWVAYVQGLL